jgi:hypothetical protein
MSFFSSTSSAVAEGILTDNPHLVLLFYLSQLFVRELLKSHRLVQVIPMDMSGYYGEFEFIVWNGAVVV